MKRPAPVSAGSHLAGCRGSSDAGGCVHQAVDGSHRQKGADRHVQYAIGGVDPSGDGHLDEHEAPGSRAGRRPVASAMRSTLEAGGVAP